MKLDRIYDDKIKAFRCINLCGWCKTNAFSFYNGLKANSFTTYSLKLFYEIR